jgi:ferredoxin-type protein NapH
MENKKAGFSAYLATPLLSVAGMTVASLVSIFLLNLTGENSPVPIFVFFAFVDLVCMVLFALLSAKKKRIARHTAMFIIGSVILLLAGLLGKQNFQIEGFFFFLLAGSFGGVIIHYFVAKIIGPVITGRTWCAWGCWTAMILDLLPYKEGSSWVKGKSVFKYIYFALALIGVGVLFYGFNYSMNRIGNPVDSARALYWFLVGNGIYYAIGISLAFILKDNRAFCKYVCPASIFLKAGTIFTLARIKGDKQACTGCGDCSKDCPMSVTVKSTAPCPKARKSRFSVNSKGAMLPNLLLFVQAALSRRALSNISGD